MKPIYNQIKQISGDVIMLEAEGVSYRELACIESIQGHSLAQVIRLEGQQVYLQVMAGSRGVSTCDKLIFLGHPMQTRFGDELKGRVFNGLGLPMDDKPEIDGPAVDLAGPSVNPMKRQVPDKIIRTDIPMIDLFNSLVESQKIPIFTSPGEPYNELLARIALQSEVDLILFGGMGLKFDDYLFFKETLEKHRALSKSVLYIHTASDPSVECLMVPDICLAVAEQFAARGDRVLVLLNDMTNYCDALKEISITMEQIPSNRGYPGDLYSVLASRYEKAVDLENGGSISILSITTMPGDDVTHPVPDNTGYITEGQFYLKNGRIEPFGSLSRLRQLVNSKTRSDHRVIMDKMIQFYADYREVIEKRDMGFSMNPWDQKLLVFGQSFENEIMDLNISLPLEKSLDLCWEILARSFKPVENGYPK